jgi:hypothetical protein
MNNQEHAQLLGWASIGIGLSELLAPRAIEQKCLGIGNGQNTGVLRVLGVREICHGIDLLSHRDPAPGVWARVLGDVLDTVVLAAAGRKTKRPVSFGATAASVMAIGIADALFASRVGVPDPMRRHP